MPYYRYDEYLLKTVTWKDATGLTGCYAINAAQDGGACRPCIADLEQVRITAGPRMGACRPCIADLEQVRITAQGVGRVSQPRGPGRGM